MKSILVATANREQMGSLTGLLEKNGYFVIPASDIDLALAFLDRIPVDAVLADYQIKDFSRLMRAVRTSRAVPPRVIAMSERVVVSDYLGALSAGVHDFFFWPIRACEFLKIVQTALRENAAQPSFDGKSRYAFTASTPWSGFDQFL